MEINDNIELSIAIIKNAQEKLCDKNLVYLIPKEYSKKAEGYFSMRIDIMFLLESIDTILQNQLSDIIRSSIWFSIIAIHGKCFTNASNADYPKLELNDLSDEDANIQKHLMNLRHNFIAHRGITKYECSSLFMLIPKEGELSGLTELRLLGLKQNNPEHQELLNYKQYFHTLLEITNNKIQKSVERAKKGFLNLDPKIGQYYLINNMIAE